MRRRVPVLGVLLILIGAGGLMWLSADEGALWVNTPWRRGPSGRGGFFRGPGMMPWVGPGVMWGWAQGVYGKNRFDSNGEQIYYTGVSQKSGPIPREGGPPWVYHNGVGCVACHGVHGRGGIPVMMGTAIPEDIRYAVLTGKGQEPGGEKMVHPPYTDSTIRQAITQGVDPAGKPLDWTMPRWRMGDADLNDVLAYLKSFQ